MKDKEKIHEIHERIYQFVVRVLKLIKLLPKTPENLIIIYQITKSVTSMGANDQEADGCDSKKDFVAKYAIVRKEGKEIVKVVSTIIVNTKNNK
jgi:four helix bundle protein